MEKKTIGTFIAALRRANGLTQRELAEKLNVSDKAVSRWERDESAPDLTLLPVIAEIFGVTTDELLRGERMERDETPGGKSEKQLAQLLKSTRQKLHGQCGVALMLCGAGLLVALILNFALYGIGDYRLIAYFAAALFYLVALAGSVMAAVRALSGLGDEPTADETVDACRRDVFCMAAKTVACVLGFAFATLPCMILIQSGKWMNQREFLTAWPLLMAVVVAFPVLLYFTAVRVATHRGLFALSLKKWRCQWGVSLLLLFTLMAQSIMNTELSPTVFTSGTEFHDMEAFIEYVETNKASDYIEYECPIHGTMQVTSHTVEGPVTVAREYIYDLEGYRRIASYVPLNPEVAEVKPANTEDRLPITVYTWADYHKGMDVMVAINIGIGVLCVLEVTAGVLVSRRIKKKAE